MNVEENINALVPYLSKGRHRVLLQGKVDCITLGDYRSDESAIDRKCLQKLKVHQASMHTMALHRPCELSLAPNSTDENSIILNASQKVTRSIKINLSNKNIPVRIHRFPFLVFDQDTVDILLALVSPKNCL